MEPKTAFMQIVRQRYSCRSYTSDRAVPEDTLRQCLEAARLAPSACNKQPWRFVVVDDPHLLRALREQAQLPGVDHSWWDTVPVMVALGIEKSTVTHRLAPAVSKIPYQLLDAGIAGEHFVLAATAAGLATCWIGWFKPKVVQRILQMPRRMDVVALLAVGYPAEDRRPETSRKASEEIAFRNSYGKVFEECPDPAIS